MGRGAVNQKGPAGGVSSPRFTRSAARARSRRSTWCWSPRARRRSARRTSRQVVRRPEVAAALKRTASASSCRSAGQDPDGKVTVSLGAKGVVELELVASGEKWGRGPEQGRPLEQPGAPRQPVVPPGAGARDAGRRRRRPGDRRLRRRGAPADRRGAGACWTRRRRGSTSRPRRSCSRRERWAHDLPWRDVAGAVPLLADREHRGPGRGLHRTGRQDGAAAPGRGQARPAAGAGHDLRRGRRRAQGAPRRSVASATSR